MKSFFSFWWKQFTHPKDFFKKVMNPHKKPLPYFWVVMVIFCISSGIDRMDYLIAKYDGPDTSDMFLLLNTWPNYWIGIVICGIIGGTLLYYVGGWWYNTRLKWTGATGDQVFSRRIYLYTKFWTSVLTIFTTLIITTYLPDPVSADYGFGILLILATGLAYTYSVVLSYFAVRAYPSGDLAKKRLWFLILPMIGAGIGVFVVLISMFFIILDHTLHLY